MHPFITMGAERMADQRSKANPRVRQLTNEFADVVAQVLGDQGLTEGQLGSVILLVSGAILGKIAQGDRLEDVCSAASYVGAFLVKESPDKPFDYKDYDGDVPLLTALYPVDQ